MIKDTALLQGAGANPGDYEDLVNMVAASAAEGKLCYAYAERMKIVARPKKSAEEVTQDKSFDSAQDKQDEIFRRMSADEKVRLGAQLWRLAKDLVGKKIDYGRGRSKISVGKDRKNS